ncbi:queuosine precursor transporter [Salinibaculum rarum]|uniref:queuosine precursor transporter n=1 Tax=Salinibaculum rarum TaxID=3058903 RepID=UPI00266058E6|nr:queuosine precursor transporter [Salinibaculum sp. KK48]
MTRINPSSAPTPTLGQVSLIALFVTALVTAQLTAAKILQFTLPFSLPITGNALILPGAAVAYALTYFATDCYSELYGRRAAQYIVNVGFVMNVVLLALVWTTITAPAARSSIDPAMFENVLAASTNIVAASLIAYIVSQNTDVYLFHAIRDQTSGKHLWLRNIGSTAVSQAIDTVIFVVVGFWLAPQFLQSGVVLPAAVLAQLLVGQYILKVGVAILDTPFVYGTIALLERHDQRPAADTSTPQR